jgi:hypothetical protein
MIPIKNFSEELPERTPPHPLLQIPLSHFETFTIITPASIKESSSLVVVRKASKKKHVKRMMVNLLNAN